MWKDMEEKCYLSFFPFFSLLNKQGIPSLLASPLPFPSLPSPCHHFLCFLNCCPNKCYGILQVISRVFDVDLYNDHFRSDLALVNHELSFDLLSGILKMSSTDMSVR